MSTAIASNYLNFSSWRGLWAQTLLTVEADAPSPCFSDDFGGQFARRQTLLKNTLLDHGIDLTIVGELLAHNEKLRPAVLNLPDQDCLTMTQTGPWSPMCELRSAKMLRPIKAKPAKAKRNRASLRLQRCRRNLIAPHRRLPMTEKQREKIDRPNQRLHHIAHKCG